MKKWAVLVAVLALVLSFGLAACSNSGETVTGEYKYESQYGTYGCKVDVTVADGKITKVKLYSEEETGWTQVSPSWQAGMPAGSLGHDECEAKTPDYLKKFEGKTVEEINAITVSIQGVENGTENSISDSSLAFTGATQSGARIIKAVQNALSKLK